MNHYNLSGIGQHGSRLDTTANGAGFSWGGAVLAPGGFSLSANVGMNPWVSGPFSEKIHHEVVETGSLSSASSMYFGNVAAGVQLLQWQNLTARGYIGFDVRSNLYSTTVEGGEDTLFNLRWISGQVGGTVQYAVNPNFNVIFGGQYSPVVQALSGGTTYRGDGWGVNGGAQFTIPGYERYAIAIYGGAMDMCATGYVFGMRSEVSATNYYAQARLLIELSGLNVNDFAAVLDPH